MENWRKVAIFAATITVWTMGCERHKLHIYRTGNVESLHFETSQMECGRLIREDQPAFFISQFCLPNGYGNKKCRNSHQRIAAGCPTERQNTTNLLFDIQLVNDVKLGDSFKIVQQIVHQQ